MGIGALLLDGLGQDARGTTGSESEPTKPIQKRIRLHTSLIYSASMNKIRQQLELFLSEQENHLNHLTYWHTGIYYLTQHLAPKVFCQGDTIRVSLTEDPEFEAKPCVALRGTGSFWTDSDFWVRRQKYVYIYKDE